MNNKQSPALRKSASLILLCAENSQKERNIKTLLLKRKSTMSFSNSYVFPGGKCEKEDIQIAKNNNFIQYSKITAIRQFLQESGMLLYPAEEESKILTVQFLSKDIVQISKQLGSIWNNYSGYIEPVVRLMTPQTIKGKRFDCMFHLCRLNDKVRLINVQLLRRDFKSQKNDKLASQLSQQNQKYRNINKTQIIFDPSQSDGYLFQSPLGILNQWKKGKLNLAPPQVMIFTALANLCATKNQHQLQQFSKDPKNNKFSEIQPIMFHANISHGKFYLFGDKNYNYQQLLDKQIDSPSKRILQKYFKQKIQKNFMQFNGIRYINLGQDAKYENSYKGKVSNSLLNFLQQTNPNQKSIEFANYPKAKI